MASSNSSRFWRPKKRCRGGNLPRTHPGLCAWVCSSRESLTPVVSSSRVRLFRPNTEKVVDKFGILGLFRPWAAQERRNHDPTLKGRQR